LFLFNLLFANLLFENVKQKTKPLGQNINNNN